MDAPDAAQPGPVLLYDGVCGLCDRLVQLVLRRDRRGRFRFAMLQGGFAAQALARHGRDPSRLATVAVLVAPGSAEERLLVRSRAIFYLLDRLGGPWRALALLRVLPAPLTDLGYDLVARVRYRIWGRYDACQRPDPTLRDRFLD